MSLILVALLLKCGLLRVAAEPRGSARQAPGAVHAAAGSSACPIPMAKGARWRYRGRLAWTREPGGVASRFIEWTTEVIQSFSNDTVQAAVVRGLPFELAWAVPETPPACSVLWAARDSVFTVSAPDSAQADSIARALLRAPGHPSGGLLLLVAPLR